jgi:hypothetical protein
MAILANVIVPNRVIFNCKRNGKDRFPDEVTGSSPAALLISDALSQTRAAKAQRRQSLGREILGHIGE